MYIPFVIIIYLKHATACWTIVRRLSRSTAATRWIMLTFKSFRAHMLPLLIRSFRNPTPLIAKSYRDSSPESEEPKLSENFSILPKHLQSGHELSLSLLGQSEVMHHLVWRCKSLNTLSLLYDRNDLLLKKVVVTDTRNRTDFRTMSSRTLCLFQKKLPKMKSAVKAHQRTHTVM